MKPLRSLLALRVSVGLMGALWVLTGCSSFRTEMGRPLPAQTRELVEGRTRVDQVIRDLGPPHQASRLPDGFAFLYEYSLLREFQLGISVNLPILRWFKYVHAWNYLDQQCLILIFDDQGVLRSTGAGKWEEDLGGGNALQFLFSVMSLSEVSKIVRPEDAHAWGETMLQLPPVALNSAQSLRSGEHGLEQRIAPSYAGQHTLEMAKPKTEREKKRAKKNYQQENP